jgi:integrase
MKKLLTDTGVRALAPSYKRYTVHDSIVPGLGVRVYPSAHKTYALGARYPGSHHFKWRELGQVGAITLAAARDKARDWPTKIQKGDDPKQVERAAQANTFASVAEAFITRHARSKRRAHIIEREIRRELIPILGKRPIETITRRELIELLEAIKDRGTTGAYARNVYIHLSSIFNWAVARDILERSPFDHFKPRQIFGEKRVRERVLSNDEIRAIWNAEVGYPLQPFVRWLLLTGTRHNEALGARWREFSTEWWTIPPERFKSNSTHIVPLTDDMRALLDSLPRWNHGDHLFTMTGDRPYGGAGYGKRRLDQIAGVTGYVFHDLRRTMRTRLSALRVPYEIAELAIGHSKRGLARVYDQHQYEAELREAFTAWNTMLRGIVS